MGRNLKLTCSFKTLCELHPFSFQVDNFCWHHPDRMFIEVSCSIKYVLCFVESHENNALPKRAWSWMNGFMNRIMNLEILSAKEVKTINDSYPDIFCFVHSNSATSLVCTGYSVSLNSVSTRALIVSKYLCRHVGSDFTWRWTILDKKQCSNINRKEMKTLELLYFFTSCSKININCCIAKAQMYQ